MAADGHTNNFQGLTSFLNIQVFYFCCYHYFFFQRAHHKVQDLEIQFIQKQVESQKKKKLSESIKSDTKAGKTRV